MRVMVLIKSNPAAEAGLAPVPEELEAMGRYNEELAGAGVTLAADGLLPSSRGARVRFADGRATVSGGPFADVTALVAGYWIWQVRSLDEAIEWLRRAPLASGAVAEIRAVADPNDTKQHERTGVPR